MTKNNRGFTVVLTAAVIALRLREYAAGSAYYDSLRGMHLLWKEF